jgi:hypothetical protein
MTTFDKREEAFEKKFAIDEELKFKAEARRNRLLGLWAAEKLGLSGEAVPMYARETVAAAFAEGGGEKAVIGKLTGDFTAKGVAVTPEEIRARMSEYLAQAVAQLKAGQ